jgi:hypothetical protein
MVLSGDPRREKYRDTIPDMVRLVLQELHQYGVPSAAQGLVEWHPDVLTLPVIGYFDYRWDQHGILVDLKTTEKIPGEIKPSHARQVALYVGDSNTVGHLIYVSSKRIEPYLLENAVEHREVLLRIALRLEKFLSASDDPDYFVDVTVPDIESFYWSNPVARALAFEHWRI